MPSIIVDADVVGGTVGGVAEAGPTTANPTRESALRGCPVLHREREPLRLGGHATPPAGAAATADNAAADIAVGAHQAIVTSGAIGNHAASPPLAGLARSPVSSTPSLQASPSLLALQTGGVVVRPHPESPARPCSHGHVVISGLRIDELAVAELIGTGRGAIGVVGRPRADPNRTRKSKSGGERDIRCRWARSSTFIATRRARPGATWTTKLSSGFVSESSPAKNSTGSSDAATLDAEEMFPRRS